MRDCRPQLERKCFPYVGKEYRPDGRKHPETYTWVNQKLERLEDKNITKCHEVSTCNIEVYYLGGSYTITMSFFQTVNREISKRVPKRECENIPKSRKVCRSVQVPQPPIVSLVDFCNPKRLLPPGGADTELQDGVQEAVLHGQQAGLPPGALPVQRKPHLTNPWVPTPAVPDSMLCQVVQKNVCPTCMEPSYPGRGCGTPTCMNPGTIGMGGSTLAVSKLSLTPSCRED